MQINLASRKVNCKIVYYGPGCSGKTTNIQHVHHDMPQQRKSNLTSIATEGDRTLFFDFMSLDLGQVMGMDTCFQLYTVPGQVYYDATRKLVLQGVDGLVFVADSSPDRYEANLESWKNLQDNLAAYRLTLSDLPIVIQFNKRDVPGALPVEKLNQAINPMNFPTFEAVACRGEGVLATLKCVCSKVLQSLNRRVAPTHADRPASPRPAATAPTQPQPVGAATATLPDPVPARIAMVALDAPSAQPRPSVPAPRPLPPLPTQSAVRRTRPATIARPAPVPNPDSKWPWVAAGFVAAAAVAVVILLTM